MKSLFEVITEAITSPEMKKLVANLSRYELALDVKGWGFKKPSYKVAKKPNNEFKISIKDARSFLNGKDDYQGFYINNIYIFLKAFEFEGAPYISIVFRITDEGDWTNGEDFCVLNSIEGIEPFIRWCLKPHKNKTKSDIGPDGELKIWYEKMPKTYTPEIKPYVCDKRLISKMGDLVKINCTE